MKFSAALFLAGIQLCSALVISPAAKVTGEVVELGEGIEKRDNFDLSCRNWGLLYPQFPSVLYATCKRTDGSENYSTLSLKKCLTNEGGQLKWLPM